MYANLDVLSGYINNITQLISANQQLTTQLRQTQLSDTITEQLNHIEQLQTQLDINYILTDMPELISEALSGTERVKEIVADLKDYSHMRQHAMAFEDINQLIEQAISISNNETKYTLHINKQFSPIPKVECWRGKITQVILNLLLNANQATNDDGQITISTNADEQYVYINLKDNGCGISQENLPKIFDPFFTDRKSVV